MRLSASGSPAGADVSLTPSQSRLVVRRAGFDTTIRRSRPWDFLAVVLDLARRGDGEDYGSHVAGRAVPFRANSMLVVFDAAGVHEYARIPAAANRVERHTVEFRIGLDPAARRTIMPGLDEETQRVWTQAGA